MSPAPPDPPLSSPAASWPRDAAGQPARRVLFLLDASSRYEERWLRQWIETSRPEQVAPTDVEVLCVPPTRRRRRRAKLDPRLEATLAATADPLLTPLRVAWLAPLRRGVREASFRHFLTFTDPRDPGAFRQRWIRLRDPGRCRVVVGGAAPASELRERWRAAGGTDAAATTGLAEFVARQATLALERAERQIRGARYKVPRLVHEEILGRPAFRGEVARLARELGQNEAAATRRAARLLREVAATHSPLVIDVVARLIRLMYTQGYDEALQYDREQLAGISRLSQRHPVVFLPTHKSNLDHLVLQYALHENGLPPNHTAGGINMNFFPLGQLVRRSGVFFIRRSFKDDELYKLVLRSYVDYLIEKRFSLEWYIEGGRSRSGKLLPPRFGLLAYVVDAYRRARAEDVFLIPVSIAYDQIQDVRSYAAEQRGGAKQTESLGWFVGVIRSLRRRYGRINIRFGEPLSLAKSLGPPDPGAAPDPDEQNLTLQKLAFEVSVRINRATPITPISLVTLALLETDRAVTVGETREALADILEFVADRKLPSTTELEHLATDEGVCAALDALAENHVVSCYAGGPEAVYAIGPDQQLAAAYYRNTVVHFFVDASIAELALLAASESPPGDPTDAFWDSTMALRDLLKFEFFFPEKDEFRAGLRREMAHHDAEWEERLATGPTGARHLVLGFRPLSAHRILRPFLEAYAVVASNLERWPADQGVDRERFVEQCLALGRQDQLRKRIRSAEAVSKVLFQTGLKLAANRGLLEPGEAVDEARLDFAAEVRDALRRVDAIEALGASRRAGLPL